MERGSFKYFVDLISPLSGDYGDFSVYVNIFEAEKAFDAPPIKKMLPLCDIEINETDIEEVCLMVRGLGELEQQENSTPLDVDSFIKKLIEIKETCQDHSIVLAQKDYCIAEDGDEPDDGDDGDYIVFHLPIDQIKTDSDDDKNIFYLLTIRLNETYEHIHYGNINKPNSEGIIYKGASLDDFE